MDYLYTAYDSPIGPIHLLKGDKGLLAVGLSGDFNNFRAREGKIFSGAWKQVATDNDPILKRTVDALTAYFDEGVPFPGDVPLDPHGTAFQLKIWKALCRIPHGETRSYGQIAKAIGKPKAARAVGRACATNPISLFIPCHRVIGGDGGLHGFGGGLDVKDQLLTLEGLDSRKQ